MRSLLSSKVFLCHVTMSCKGLIEALTKVGSIPAALLYPGLSPREEGGARARFPEQRLVIDPMTNVKGAQLA